MNPLSMMLWADAIQIFALLIIVGVLVGGGK